MAGKSQFLHGWVKMWDSEKRFGFISPSERGSQGDVHCHAMQLCNDDSLERGQEVLYMLEWDGRKGKYSAFNVLRKDSSQFDGIAQATGTGVRPGQEPWADSGGRAAGGADGSWRGSGAARERADESNGWRHSSGGFGAEGERHGGDRGLASAPWREKAGSGATHQGDQADRADAQRGWSGSADQAGRGDAQQGWSGSSDQAGRADAQQGWSGSGDQAGRADAQQGWSGSGDQATAGGVPDTPTPPSTISKAQAPAPPSTISKAQAPAPPSTLSKAEAPAPPSTLSKAQATVPPSTLSKAQAPPLLPAVSKAQAPALPVPAALKGQAPPLPTPVGLRRPPAAPVEAPAAVDDAGPAAEDPPGLGPQAEAGEGAERGWGAEEDGGAEEYAAGADQSWGAQQGWAPSKADNGWHEPGEAKAWGGWPPGGAKGAAKGKGVLKGRGKGAFRASPF